jgi:Tol biopolymer transport system component
MAGLLRNPQPWDLFGVGSSVPVAVDISSSDFDQQPGLTLSSSRSYNPRIQHSRDFCSSWRIFMKKNRHLKAVLYAIVIALLATSRAWGNGFSLEQVLSSPFPSDLIASPKGDKLAWVFNAEGKRNIWIAEAPEFKGRQLTRYDKDDGQEITEPEFSPDGNWIAFVYGGPPNSEKDIPNPTSDPAGALQEVRVANVRTGTVIKVGEGTSPMFSPGSDRVIFEGDNHLWWVPLPSAAAPKNATAAKAITAPKKMFEIRGSVSSPRWSPDGSRLVFVSSRGDHSFISIYNPKAGEIRFLEPSVDRDIEPRWSADGKRIAFIRLFNITDVPSPDRERVVPWAIRVVNADGTQGKEIWRSGNTTMDSFSRLPLGENILQWGASDRIVLCIREGWLGPPVFGCRRGRRRDGTNSRQL